MIRHRRLSTIGLTALALLAGGARLLAQKGTTAGLEMQPSPRVVDNARADSLEGEAERLYSKPDAYAAAARLQLESAALRQPGDPRRVHSMAMAGHLFGYSGHVGKARATMEATAEESLAFGDLVGAAGAEVNAAFLALRQGNRPEALRLADRARWIAGLPRIESGERAAILRRIDGRTPVGARGGTTR